MKQSLKVLKKKKMKKVKIITACGIKHKQYMESCLKSTARLDCEHLYLIRDWSKHEQINELLKQVDDDDIVGLLDADDLAAPDWLNHVKLLDIYDLVYGDTLNIDKNYDTVLHKSLRFNPETIRKKCLIQYSGVLLNGWLAKSEAYPNFFGGEDWLWWSRLLRRSNKFHYTGEVHAFRRNYTSHIRRNIPIYSKFNRLYRDFKVRKIIRNEFNYFQQRQGNAARLIN